MYVTWSHLQGSTLECLILILATCLLVGRIKHKSPSEQEQWRRFPHRNPPSLRKQRAHSASRIHLEAWYSRGRHSAVWDWKQTEPSIASSLHIYLQPQPKNVTIRQEARSGLTAICGAFEWLEVLEAVQVMFVRHSISLVCPWLRNPKRGRDLGSRYFGGWGWERMTDLDGKEGREGAKLMDRATCDDIQSNLVVVSASREQLHRIFYKKARFHCNSYTKLMPSSLTVERCLFFSMSCLMHTCTSEVAP